MLGTKVVTMKWTIPFLKMQLFMTPFKNSLLTMLVLLLLLMQQVRLFCFSFRRLWLKMPLCDLLHDTMKTVILLYHVPQEEELPIQNLGSASKAQIKQSIQNALFSNNHYKHYTISNSASIGNFSGIISERDYVKKIALLGRISKETQIKDIYIHSGNVLTASVEESVEKAMETMMTKSIRHLPILDGSKLVGMVSIKDLIKEVVADREKTIRDLSDLALGKGATL